MNENGFSNGNLIPEHESLVKNMDPKDSGNPVVEKHGEDQCCEHDSKKPSKRNNPV